MDSRIRTAVAGVEAYVVGGAVRDELLGRQIVDVDVATPDPEVAARIYAGLFDGSERASHALAPGRRAYLHVVCGLLTANGTPLAAGDALKLAGVADIVLEKGANAEALLFDLA